MNLKCPKCHVVNFLNAEKCVRCGNVFDAPEIVADERIVDPKPSDSNLSAIVRRVIICAVVCFLTILSFYLSLIYTAEPLSVAEKQQVNTAIAELDAKGFHREAYYLKHFAVFRAGDNWFNASAAKESAYAATNFPFEVIALYPEFFTVPQDDTERAMILLHEAQHLRGKDEKAAYEFVWKNRAQLGWTKDKYFNSTIWRNVRKQTKEFAPNLFVCDFNDYGDCTEWSITN